MRCLFVAAWFGGLAIVAVIPQEFDPEGPLNRSTDPRIPSTYEYFEKRIRPILAQECYECHRTEGTQKGGLVLDHRAGLLRGGDSGPAIVPGDADSSLLIRAMRHDHEDLQMPKARAKLEDSVIHDFVVWVESGALDPRDHPATESEVEKDTTWLAILERRKQWWSFQPIQQPIVPRLDDSPEAPHPVDRFIHARLNEDDLEPAGLADQAVLLRRLSFALTGLPPTPQALEGFVNDPRPEAYDEHVDTYLASPQFGERWARHWMDWIRYAESHGSEGDPDIPNAWRYRDYLIRALNEDVAYDQLVREHLAGDLLTSPRINNALRLNESSLGTAQLRMVFHGFAPTDPLDELVKFTDDQIDVLSKAFQAITVSCARCHHHKFDPISQQDYYAWYGIFASGRPSMNRADIPSQDDLLIRRDLSDVKQSIKEGLMESWMQALDRLGQLILQPSESQLEAWNTNKGDPVLAPLVEWQKDRDVFSSQWEQWKREWQTAEESDSNSKILQQWNLDRTADLNQWFRQGPSLSQPSKAGEFIVSLEGNAIVSGILPVGVYSHLISTKDRGVLHSPKIDLNEPYDLWMRLAGDGNAMARYSVRHYPRDGTVYPVERLNGSKWVWKKFPLDYWQGDSIHIEITTAADQPVLAQANSSRSWFGIQEVLLTQAGSSPPRNTYQMIQRLLVDSSKGSVPKDLNGLAALYQSIAKACLDAWRNNQLQDAQALFLDGLVRHQLLPNQLDYDAELQRRVLAYRAMERELPTPIRSPGVMETVGVDQPLFERGNHKQPRELVPRRFLEFLDATPYATRQSGRMELAEDLLRPDNPLTARVIVNRIWHHLFGRGIVATPDNFGRLGQKPSHPELLDYLAHRFKEEGWSIKAMIRFIVRSETWRRASVPTNRAKSMDPDNVLLSHYPLRRLDAEAIRDSILAVGGQLDSTTMYGPPVAGEGHRRSIYVKVKRNDLDPFLSRFDAPVPASTQGSRDATNVPGQSLTLLNDAFVLRAAEEWAQPFQDQSGFTLEARRSVVQKLFLQALGRDATREEIEWAGEFMTDMQSLRTSNQQTIESLEKDVERTRQQRQAIQQTGFQRIIGNSSPSRQGNPEPMPHLIAEWNFSESESDPFGALNLELLNGARIENGALVLDGHQAFARTPLLDFSIAEKTLEAWVQLDNPDQQGGGVISIQNSAGDVFDAIVFGEQQTRRWMAGSEFFKRTKPFNGTEESHAKDEWVHVAIAYSFDGRIKAYRQGESYGQSYLGGDLTTFEAGDARILLGNRHGNPGGNRMFKGRIAIARLYNQALTESEIERSFNENTDLISLEKIVKHLSDSERRLWDELQAKEKAMERKRELLIPSKGLSSVWADLAHAVFNLKEFIYLR